MSKRVLIIGAGVAGRMVAREITGHADSGLAVVGYLDDNTSLAGTQPEGVAVLGPTDRLVESVSRHAVEEVIIAIPSAGRDAVRRIVALCRDAGVQFKIVPGLIEIIRGEVRLEQIRRVQPDDLLGRETVEFDEAEIRKRLAGRRVMVTGAGGSIGGEICRQVARFGLSELQAFGRGENQIYQIEWELRSLYPDVNVRSIIGDVRDARGLQQTFERFKPEFVYHAAAHKHVHYMEAYPEEAVKNNIIGTGNIIRVCRESGVERLVMLSTDKAVKPQGVMGASKRVAEYLMLNGAGEAGLPRCITVRFGNVLGSRGSVIPLFMQQIRAGGPVTVSHPEASRYFMTLKEACMLVVQASIMGMGGETFVLRMGTPIRILEMAKDLIAMHGMTADEDIEIRVTGLRPGEKLHESLIAEGEDVADSSHEFILKSRPELPPGWNSDDVIDEFSTLADAGDRAGIRNLLRRLVADADLG